MIKSADSLFGMMRGDGRSAPGRVLLSVTPSTSRDIPAF